MGKHVCFQCDDNTCFHRSKVGLALLFLIVCEASGFSPRPKPSLCEIVVTFCSKVYGFVWQLGHIFFTFLG